ncbi:MAG: FAD-binding oxidoreductase [Chloroflexi bacterium]|nr:FAD-binding oxidoreductase [Chloroflexota bacterium]
MTASPEIVIVGAGAIGCATAYYLARQGAKVLVMDREAIGAGASFHATGLFSPWRASSNPALNHLFDTSLRLSQELLPRLKEETGVDTLFQVAQGLRVALGRSRWRRARLLPPLLVWLERSWPIWMARRPAG